MKKYISLFASLLAVLAVASCEKDKYGTVPGNDSKPYVVVNVYTPELPADPDCDAYVRVAANNATTELYYFAEPIATKEARNLPEAEYANYVVENGTKVSGTTVSEFDGSLGAEFLLPKLFGKNIISVVAVGQNGKYLGSAEFYGLKWNTIATGTYQFGSSAIKSVLGATKSGVLLQQSDDDKTLYRFKDLFKDGVHLQVVAYPKYTATDDDGTYTFLRVPAQATGLNHATYGAMSVRDYGYRYGDDGYIFEGGYEGGIYEDNSIFLYLHVYVSAGNFGGAYDFFIPDTNN